MSEQPKKYPDCIMADPDSQTCVGIRERHNQAWDQEVQRSIGAYKADHPTDGSFYRLTNIKCAVCGIEYPSYQMHVHSPRECDRCTFHIKCYGY
jgi:hypothetical protein